MNSLHPEPVASWQRVLLLTLALEAAFLSENWIEFGQLCRRRSEELFALGENGSPLDIALTEQIQEIDARVMASLAARRKQIGQEMRKLAEFRRAGRPA